MIPRWLSFFGFDRPPFGKEIEDGDLWLPSSRKEVVEEIVECSGTQFDPGVVKAFFAMEEERDRDFFKNSAVTVDKVLRKNGVASVSKDLRYLKKSMMPDSIGWLVSDHRTILVPVKD